MNYSSTYNQSTSFFKLTVAIFFTLLTSAVIAVLLRYVSSDYSWIGGLQRLVHLLLAGAFMATFPILAAGAVVIDRLREGKTTVLPAVIAAATTWLAQYAILLIVLRMGPYVGDAVYGVLSVSFAVFLALFVTGRRSATTARGTSKKSTGRRSSNR